MRQLHHRPDGRADAVELNAGVSGRMLSEQTYGRGAAKTTAGDFVGKVAIVNDSISYTAR
jgi:hypothetical protein